jgi:hypothetical protein
MKCIYAIDLNDRFCRVNPLWDDFAKKNQAPHLVASRIIGQSMWDHISNPETRDIYRKLVQNVRLRGAEADFEFRCDSPTLRRFMTMHISRSDRDDVIFVSTLVASEQRPYQSMMDPAVEHSQADPVACCSWCKQFRLPDGQWCEIEEAIVPLELFKAPLPPPISHSICPGCQKRMTGVADALGQ